ncbi:MAG: hypothetical protein IH597_03910 [Bacteroidales bacterium]|nr:hypothetical protein [Bacteroidales bacterium]
MDDLIYILAGIAWVAYSIYNARQKKKLKEERERTVPKAEPVYEPEPASTPTRSIFEEIFKEAGLNEFDEELEENVKPATAEISAKTQYFTYEDTDIEIKAAEDLIKKEAPAFSEHFVAENVPYHEMKEKTRSNIFDLRKAVIYSAILERPYH